MSVQIFLLGKILGIEDFLLARPEEAALPERAAEDLLAGRSHWVTLLGEVLPRALLSELGLAKILLGSSGGGQFLVVLPDEARAQAEDFLSAAGHQIEDLSGGRLRLAWAVTENLGDWSDVRKRLAEVMQRRRITPVAYEAPSFFEPHAATSSGPSEYFHELALGFRTAETAGWSPATPGKVLLGTGKYTWPVGSSQEGIPLARHAAPTDDGSAVADKSTLAYRAEGRPAWGVLRGDVDSFGVRIHRAQTIEEHVQLSVVYKQFFAGELEILCSMPDFWRKVTILYSGGDDFAVYGAWDALIPLAREVQRLFHRLSEENLRDFPGAEGKTISMALAVAGENDESLSSVYESAGEKLELAKSAGKDCFHLLGRTLEWRLVADAAEMKDMMSRMVLEFGCSPQFLGEIGSFYRESAGAGPLKRTEKANHFDRPWRFHRRLNRVMGGSRDREFQKLRANLMSEFIAKGTAQLKLRPSGRVALEWARLLTGV